MKMSTKNGNKSISQIPSFTPKHYFLEKNMNRTAINSEIIFTNVEVREFSTVLVLRASNKWLQSGSGD